MLIATWNVNSIRMRLSQVQKLLDEIKPDLLCIQETKVQDEFFPKEDFIDKGYKVNYFGQKSYNGVALISSKDIEDVRYGFEGEMPKDPNDIILEDQKRIISCLIDGIRVVNVYVPNGSSLTSSKYEYKINWLKSLNRYLKSQELREEPLCLLGDFNIAIDDRDIHNPNRLSGGIMASNKERSGLIDIIGDKLKDAFRIFESESNHWTWWDYRSNAWSRDSGWRIDHIYLSEELIRNTKSCFIMKNFRGLSQPSDHAPVVVEISWPLLIEEATEDNFFI